MREQINTLIEELNDAKNKAINQDIKHWLTYIINRLRIIIEDEQRTTLGEK